MLDLNIEFRADQFEVSVYDEYGDKFVLWFNTQEEVNKRIDEYPQYNYIIQEKGNVTLGMMLSLDAGKTYEILWLANDLSDMQIEAYLSNNKNYLIGLVYSGKTCQQISEDAAKDNLNKAYNYQNMLMRSKD
jgi:hypothetical protein